MKRSHAGAQRPPRVLLLGVAASLAAASVSVLAAQPVSAAEAAEATEAEPCAVVNGGFEEPGGLRGQGHLRKDVPGWRTSSSDGLIEIWGAGNHADPMDFTVPPDTGDQFAELNGTSVSTLYQDIRTVPGSTVDWSLAHRGRTRTQGGQDVMRVRIGGVVQVPEGQDSPDIADGGDTWGHYGGSYTVPRGQRVTRVEFVSVSSGTGRPSYGNFLDSVSTSCASPNQPPTAPYLVLSGSVGQTLDGSLTSVDPEGGEVTYSATTPVPWLNVTVRPHGTVVARAIRPGVHQVPVKACDERGACADGRVVVVAYRRTRPLARSLADLYPMQSATPPAGPFPAGAVGKDRRMP
ncbi:hypothetical protein SAMN05216275_14226 [Streptosporangium canum]|uniref:Uncharacterized protein n=1 Tax=Streptosporangium canum TaxID=324952 RepID=A0A1I4DLX3_9ACTN|nr:hypothetical protein [Streptosporangium canum]SFK94265.1 hypothetical protein SAMN05216275_14226 [Streptosporangium canum]